MKKAALSLAFVFLFGTIAVNAQNPKKEAKKAPVTEQKKPEVKKADKKVKATTPVKPIHKKKGHKKVTKNVKKAESNARVAQ